VVPSSQRLHRSRGRSISSTRCRGGQILDVGGGNGFVARRLLDEGFPVVLMEPGAAGASNAKLQRLLPDVICSTIEDADLPEGTVSSIGLFDVLEHIKDDGAFLEHLAGRLVGGGRLYITVPIWSWLWSNADVDAGHHRRYSPDSLRSIVSASFEVEFLSCFFGPLVLPVLLCRAAPYRLGLRSATMSAEREHGALPGPIREGWRRLLAREAKALRDGRWTRRWGTSLICAARKRAVE